MTGLHYPAWEFRGTSVIYFFQIDKIQRVCNAVDPDFALQLLMWLLCLFYISIGIVPMSFSQLQEFDLIGFNFAVKITRCKFYSKSFFSPVELTVFFFFFFYPSATFKDLNAMPFVILNTLLHLLIPFHCQWHYSPCLVIIIKKTKKRNPTHGMGGKKNKFWINWRWI